MKGPVLSMSASSVVEPEEASTDIEENEELEDNGNTGWADSMSKILKSKKPKNKKTTVLSKAKKYSETTKRTKKPDFEIINEADVKVEQDDDEEEEEERPPLKKKRDEERHPNLRLKPDILEKEREKLLSKIATRGVVQLFNAVRNQQKDLEKQLEAVGPVQRKREKVIKSLDKNKFLDVLMGQSKSQLINDSLLKKVKKDEAKEEKPSTWNVFRDDFMMGAKMKDWDKSQQTEESLEANEEENSDSD